MTVEERDQIEEQNADKYFNKQQDVLTEQEAIEQGYILGFGDFVKNPLCRALGYNDPRYVQRMIKDKNPEWLAKVATDKNIYGVITKYKQEALDYAEQLFADTQNAKTRSVWKTIEIDDEPFQNIGKSTESLLLNIVGLKSHWEEKELYSYMSQKYRLNKGEVAALKKILTR